MLNETGHEPVETTWKNLFSIGGHVESVNNRKKIGLFSKPFHFDNSISGIELNRFPQKSVLTTTITKFIYIYYICYQECEELI